MSFFIPDFPGKKRQKLSTFFAKNIGIFWGFSQKHVIPGRARPKTPFLPSFYSKKVAIFGFWPLFWPLFGVENGREMRFFSQILYSWRAQTRVPRLSMLPSKPLFSKSGGGGTPPKPGGFDRGGGVGPPKGGSDPPNRGVPPTGLGLTAQKLSCCRRCRPKKDFPLRENPFLVGGADCFIDWGQ